MHQPDTDTLRSLDALAGLPLSPDLWKDLSAVDDAAPDAVERLVEIIRGDPVLAAEFTEAVRGTRCVAPGAGEVRRAVQARGTTSARCLVLTILVKHGLLEWARPGSQLDLSTWWRHSLGTALAGTRICALVPVRSVTACYAAGLMHDAGILAVDRYAPQVLDAIWMASRMAEGAAAEDERILGASHPELGRILSERWSLPEDSLDAVFRHHAPMSAEPRNRSLACVICVADVLMSPDWAWWYGGGPEEEYRNALAHLGLDEYRLRHVRDGAESDLRRLGSVLRWPRSH